jgi:hypothetical protein
MNHGRRTTLDEGGLIVANTTKHEPNTSFFLSLSLSLSLSLIFLMLAWCSNYSEEGNARHTRRKEEMNVQEGCVSRQQHVAISGRPMEDGGAVCGGGRVLKM